MILKLVPCCRNFLILCDSKRPDDLDEKENKLDAADDGESSEEPHGASDEAQLGLRLDLLVSLDVGEGRRVKVDLHELKG